MVQVGPFLMLLVHLPVVNAALILRGEMYQYDLLLKRPLYVLSFIVVLCYFAELTTAYLQSRLPFSFLSVIM